MSGGELWLFGVVWGWSALRALGHFEDFGGFPKGRHFDSVRFKYVKFGSNFAGYWQRLVNLIPNLDQV